MIIKQFRHAVEGRSFAVYTDHKPNCIRVQTETRKKYDCSGILISSVNSLPISDMSAERTTKVADVLSRVEAATAALDYDRLAQSQSSDEELKQLLTASGTSLQFKQTKSIGSDTAVYCDISTDACKP